MKKVISLFLSIVMLLSITAGVDLSAYAAETIYTSGNYQYTLNSDGEACIVNYMGLDTALTIPKTLNNHVVSYIGGYAFYGSKLKSVTIGKNIKECYTTNIKGEEEDFYPYDLVSSGFDLGTKAGPFAGSGITTLIFETGMTYIPKNVGRACRTLKNVNIPYTVTDIRWFSFADSGIVNIDIPKYVTDIGHSAFANTSISVINLPQSLRHLGCSVFYGCKNLTKITIPKSLQSCDDYWAYNGYYYTGAFFGSGVKEVVFENGIEKIPARLFQNSPVEKVTLPDSVKTIDDYAFFVTNLSNIKLPNKLQTIGTKAFSDTYLEKVTIPANVNTIYDGAFRDNTKLTSVVISNGVKSIGNSMFYKCENLNNVNLPPSLENIGAYAFGCASFTNIKLPSNLKIIGEGAFNASSLTAITIPNKVENIYDYAFYACDNLKSVNFSDYSSLKKIYGYAFSKCNSLKSITLPKGLTTIGNYAFSECVSLKSVVFPITFEYLMGNGDFETIARTIFSYPGETTMYGCKGSTAEFIADTLGMNFVDNTLPCKSMKLISSSTIVKESSWAEIFKPIIQMNPSNSTDFYTLTSSDTSIVDVYDGVTLMAINEGKATITATSTNGIKYKFTINVTYCLHSYDNGKVTKKATCKATGVKTYTCTKCGATKTESIAKTAHIYKTITTKATTKKNGSVVTKCTVCGAVKSKSTIYYPKTIKLSKTNYTYNGKIQTPSVIVKNSKGKTLKKNTDYTVTYAKGRKNVGKYAVKITFKGKYSGSKTLYYTIKPKATSISKLTAGKKRFVARWKKQTAQTTGYQIQYSTNKNFKSAKTVTVSKNKTTSKTITKLKAKKKYYVRIRTYKTVGKTKYYSSWSNVKSVKTK